MHGDQRFEAVYVWCRRRGGGTDGVLFGRGFRDGVVAVGGGGGRGAGRGDPETRFGGFVLVLLLFVVLTVVVVVVINCCCRPLGVTISIGRRSHR